MNTHNVRVKTAATETTETRVLGPNVNGLPSGVAQTLAFLGHLAEDGMEEERTCGSAARFAVKPRGSPARCRAGLVSPSPTPAVSAGSGVAGSA